MFTNKEYVRSFFFALLAASSVAAFQNCSKPQFQYTEDNMLSSNNSDFALSDTVFRTQMNVPVEREVNYSGLIRNYKLSLNPTTLVTKIQTPEGLIEITNPETFKVRFTPNFGFRGYVSTEIFASDKYGNRTNGQVKISVGNSLSDVKPALAVRGSGCVSCHATIESNFVTDMGYGDAFFLGKSTPAYISGYFGFHDNTGHFKSIDMNPSASVIVPQVSLPADYNVAQLHPEVGSASTLGHLIEKLLTFSPFARSHNVRVEEKSKIYIGAPSESQIKTAFKVSSEKIKFIKELNSSPDLKGIVSKSGVFTNSDVVVCEGDLYLDGTVYFNNLRVVSNTGCRVYATGSIFVYGPITYVNQQPDSNFQIMSAKSIQMGLGLVEKDGAICETNGWFAEESNRKNFPDSYQDSLILRQQFDLRTGLVEKARRNFDSVAVANQIIAEHDSINKIFGNQFDASCRPESRLVGFDHIMMIAPSIHSRYQGNINGSFVAETALMALGQFKFTYDPVFDRVPIFPFIDHSQYLIVE